MSSELYMECEEEELEPWQRDISEEEEEMDEICGFKQAREFESLSPDLAVPTPPRPALLQAAPVFGCSFAQGVSLIGSNNSRGLIGSSVTQQTSVIGSNLTPVMSLIGPNAPMGTSVIGSNHTPGTFEICSNITAIKPVIGSKFLRTTSAIGPKVPAETSAISSSLPQGKPLILTQGSGGMFFLSTAQGQIPASTSKQPLLFTTQSLMPMQNMVPKLLLNLQPAQTMQPMTLFQQQPIMRTKIAPKGHNYTFLQTTSPTLTSGTLIYAPSGHSPMLVSRTTTATRSCYTSTSTPTSLVTTPTATPSHYNTKPTSVCRTNTAAPGHSTSTPTSLATTPTATAAQSTSTPTSLTTTPTTTPGHSTSTPTSGASTPMATPGHSTSTPTSWATTPTATPSHYTSTSVCRTTTAAPDHSTATSPATICTATPDRATSTATSLATTPTATPDRSTSTATSLATTPTATPDRSTSTATSLATTPTATPDRSTSTATSLATTPTATSSPYIPTQASPKMEVSSNPTVKTSGGGSATPPPPLSVVMTVGEFYYGVFSGDKSMQCQPAYEVPPNFKCKKCTFSTKSNIGLMKHYWQHTDIARRIQHEDMRCGECYRLFCSQALLETHKQQAHRDSPSPTVCRICEWVFGSEMEFLNHMKANHKPGELPYVCQVCSFRSSFYSDFLQHFCSNHAGSRHLLCILCLKVTKNSNFFQLHMNRHKLVETYPCVNCRLQFIRPQEVLEHKQRDHRSFCRPPQLSGLSPGTTVTINTTRVDNKSLPIPSRLKSPTTVCKPTAIPPQPVESSLPEPTLPDANTPLGLSEDDQVEDVAGPLCMECGNKVSEFSRHYPTVVSCLLCPYTTSCSYAYASHMIENHTPSRDKKKTIPLHKRSPPCYFELECMQCDFVSLTGDKMAKHMVLNPGHVSSACRPRTTLEEPDIEFSSQVETQQNPLPPTTTTTDPDPVEPAWTRVTEEDMASLRLCGFKKDRGLRHMPPNTADAMEYFLLAYPEALLQLIAEETNAHIKTCRYLGTPSPRWTPLSVPELKAFLGLVILMGVRGLPDMSEHWSISQPDCGTFDQAMSLRRFKQIASNIRMGSLVTDKYRGGGDPGDPLHILRPMLDILSLAMWVGYPHKCNLTVDRTLPPALEDGEGRRVITHDQTLPEIWLLCDSKSGYCHRLSIHTREGVEHGVVGLEVVPRLMKGLEGKNHRLYLANSLASPRLMRQLLNQGIYASSSFPILSPVLPQSLWQEGNLTAPGHYLQWQCGPLLATRWRDAKEMGCLCTNSFPGKPDRVWRRSQTQPGMLKAMERPMAFQLLQESMRGVDICKQLLACNPLGGVPQDRHWRSLFWFLLNLSVVNSFIALREGRKGNPPDWVLAGLFTQLNFRRRLGTQLAGCYSRPPEAPDPAGGGEGEEEWETETEAGDLLKEMHRMTKLSYRPKRCRNCHLNNLCHESVFGCTTCKVNLCGQSSCFWEFHGFSQLTTACPKVGFIRDKISGDITLEGEVIRRGDPGNYLEPLAPPGASEGLLMQEVAEQLRYTFRPEEDKEFLEGKAGVSNEEDAAAAAATAADSVPAEGAVEPEGDTLSGQQLRVSLAALCRGLQQAALEFSVDLAQVRAWVQKAKRSLMGGGDGLVAGEDRMVEWVWSMREQQLPIMENSLFQVVATLKKDGVFSKTFRSSYDWAVGLLLRHRLGLSSPHQTPAPLAPLPRPMEDEIQSSTEFARKQVEFHEIPLSAMAGVVRLNIFLDMDLMRKSSKVDWQTHALSLSGTGPPLMTAYLTVLADGTLLPTLVLLQDPSRPRGPLGKGPPPAAPLVLVETHPQGFTSAEGMEIWVRRLWRQHASTAGRPKKRLLLLDRHSDHVAEPFLTALGQTRTLPVLIPHGCSPRMQPLRVVALPILQCLLLTRWKRFIADQALHKGGGPGRDLAASIPYTLTDWLKDALIILRGRPGLLKASFRLTGLVPEEGEETPSRSQLISSLAECMLEPGVLEPAEPEEPVPMETEEQEERGRTRKTEKPIKKEFPKQGDGGEAAPSKEPTADTSSESGEQEESEEKL